MVTARSRPGSFEDEGAIAPGADRVSADRIADHLLHDLLIGGGGIVPGSREGDGRPDDRITGVGGDHRSAPVQIVRNAQSPVASRQALQHRHQRLVFLAFAEGVAEALPPDQDVLERWVVGAGTGAADVA